MKTWECKVEIRGIPTVLTFRASNYLAAKGYFETLGKILNDPRIIDEN